MLEFVEQTEVAIDEVIQVMGRATIEAVLEMRGCGRREAGRSVTSGRRHGVVWPAPVACGAAIRRRGAGEGGEVEVPAYAAMRRPGAVADRMLEVLMAGVSTRRPCDGEMADIER